MASNRPSLGRDRRDGTRDAGREGQRREFGRDGISGMVTRDRAVRAREVSRPDEGDVLRAKQVLPSLLARASGRRR